MKRIFKSHNIKQDQLLKVNRKIKKKIKNIDTEKSGKEKRP